MNRWENSTEKLKLKTKKQMGVFELKNPITKMKKKITEWVKSSSETDYKWVHKPKDGSTENFYSEKQREKYWKKISRTSVTCSKTKSGLMHRQLESNTGKRIRKGRKYFLKKCPTLGEKKIQVTYPKISMDTK